MSGYNYEYEWDSKYCYPNSYVLKNKLGIQNAEDLSEVERRITSLNILELKDKPVRGKLDLKHLRDIHYAIFHDIFTWAGQLRTVDIAKGNQFCLSQHIESYANGVFTKLKEENWLLGKSVIELVQLKLNEFNFLCFHNKLAPGNNFIKVTN